MPSNYQNLLASNCEIRLQPYLHQILDPTAQKVAVLVTNEFAGITKNGGIGTYYRVLSEKLNTEGWTVILLLCQTQQVFKGETPFESVHHIFSTAETTDSLSLQPFQQQILQQCNRTFNYESYACLFWIAAFSHHFADAVIYSEFPEIWGLGYRTIQAQKSGYLPNRCLVSVTAHGSFEWLREGNRQYFVEKLQWFLQAYHYEQFSLENANLACTPSRFLAQKYKSYGYKTDNLKHLPYFIPLLESRFTSTSSASISDRIVLVFFGRLEERKGLLTFVEAIQSLPPEITSQLQIFFLGKVVPLQSPQLSQMNSQQYIEQELGHLDIRIESQYSREAAFQFLQTLDSPIICLTSEQENLPHTALEMGQLPLTLVVAKAAGWQEAFLLVQRQEGVYWFEPGSTTALTHTLIQVVRDRPPFPKVAEIATLEAVNTSLLNQRLELMSQAFLDNTPKPPPTPQVAIALVLWQTSPTLTECLESLAQQTYDNLEVVVLSSDAEDITGSLAQIQTQFPQFKYLTAAASMSLGEAYNHLIGQIESDYILPLKGDRTLSEDAIATLVTALTHSNSAIAVSPSYQAESGQINFIDGNLLNLLELPFSHDLTALFSAEFLRQFPYNTERNLQALHWQIFAAALIADIAIAYYPYPLYCIHANNPAITDKTRLKERYYLHQYLSQIEPQRWHKRSLHLLLTGFEQLRQTPVVATSPQNQAWHLTAQQLYQELSQTQTQLTHLQSWNQQLQTSTEWLESQWQSWLLRSQKAEWEWQKYATFWQGVQSSKFWKLRDRWFKLKSKLGLSANDLLSTATPSHSVPGIPTFISRIAGQKIRFFTPQPPDTPIVSLISTCYDHLDVIETTYRSIINQTLQSFEWLIVADNSTPEATQALLATLPQRTPKIRLITPSQPQNQAASYNQALTQAQGQYLCFLDLGSILDPTYLEKSVLFLETHPQISFVNAYSIVFQGQEHWWTASLAQPQSILTQKGIWSHPLYRHRDFNNLGGFDESLQWFADWERCLKAFSQGQKGATLPEFLDGYRSTNRTTPLIAPQHHTAAQAEIQTIHSRYSQSLTHSHSPQIIPENPLQQLQFRFNLSPQNPNQTQKHLLLFCPDLDNNDLCRWHCELVQQLAQQNYEITIVTTTKSSHTLQEFFYESTPSIFHLPHLFTPAYWLAFTRYLIRSRNINLLLISDSEIAYYFLPLLRAEFPQLSLVSYYSIASNILSPSLLNQYSRFLDCQLAASHEQLHHIAANTQQSFETLSGFPKQMICTHQNELIDILKTAISISQPHSDSESTPEDQQKYLLALSQYIQQRQSSITPLEPTTNQPSSPPEPSVKELLKLLLKTAIKRLSP
ncbi:MAG: glycosyltransferase [Jaaginema sp. PMC 1078.18]|nr:glycosyltransferase [Jaaginema sp. PMC 1078.18]